MIWPSTLLFLISLLSVFKAPAKPLWYVEIGATEWGHYLVIASLLMALGIWGSERSWKFPSSLALLAAIFFAAPLVRATAVAVRLPEQLAARFGRVIPRERPGAPARSAPLVWSDLFRGVRSPAVRVTRVHYARVDGQDLDMDLFRPSSIEQPLPGVIVVHGGSWQSGDRGEFPDLSRYLAARGYLVASIDYRLAPGALFPAQREDVLAAIRYLKAHAHEMGLDPAHLALLGRSAGGQIALDAAYAAQDPAIRGVIAFYTPSDLAWGYRVPSNPLIMNSQKVLETYLGGPPSRVNYDAASPLNLVNANTPPTLMIHGGEDELVSPHHEERLSGRLEQAGRPYYYLYLPWATHGCDANFSGPCGQLSTYAVERFLAAVMRPA